MSSVVILGDLAVDATGFIEEGVQFARLDEGENVTLDLWPKLHLGGTAWMFIRALAQRSDVTPLILGAVGDDMLGRSLRQELAQTGLDISGIQTVKDAPTSIIFSCYLQSGARLMLQPGSHANQQLAASPVERYLKDQDSERVSLVWLSGYCLLGNGAPRLMAVRQVCDWARSLGIPIVIDLVPHRFRAKVGSLSRIEELIGQVFGVVGEYETYAELLSGLKVKAPLEESLHEVTARLAEDYSLIVVQHRASSTKYLQTVQYGSTTSSKVYPFRTDELRGLGDHLAVEALLDANIVGRQI